MRKSKLLVCFIVIGLMITMLTPAFGQSELEKSNYISQESVIQDNTKLLDSVKLSKLCKLFFEAKEENFLSEHKEISLTNFYEPVKAKASIGSNKDTSSKLFEFEKAVRQQTSDTLCHEKFDVTIRDVKVNGNAAKVTAYEYYEYMHENHMDILSSRGITYVIDYV